MGEVFISYAGGDQDVVDSLAAALEAAGHRTLYYQRDCPPFCDHLAWTSDAIRQAGVVALVVSSNSVASHEVDSEVKWAHRVDRWLAPILVDMAWDELEKLRPTWCRIIGSGVGATVRRDAIEAGIPRILSGLAALGVEPEPAVHPGSPAPMEGGQVTLDQILQEARVEAASRRTPVVDSALLFDTMLRHEGLAGHSFERIGVPAILLSDVLTELEDQLARSRVQGSPATPTLSPNASAVVEAARLLAAGAGDQTVTERHLLEAFVLHRESGVMGVLAQLGIEPELLAPGPWRDDGSLDVSRFAGHVLDILREALTLARPGLLGSPHLRAVLAGRGTGSTRQGPHASAAGMARPVRETPWQAGTEPHRPLPGDITRDACSTRVERILALAELLARSQGSVVRGTDLNDSILRTQPSA